MNDASPSSVCRIRGPHRSGPAIPRVAWLCAIATTLVIVGVPSAGAIRTSTTTPVVTLTPPYANLSAYPSISHTHTGCAPGKLLGNLVYHPNSGVVTFGANTSAHTCPNGTSSSDEYSLEEGLNIPIVAHTGEKDVAVKWNVTFSGIAKIFPGTCHINGTHNVGCGVSAYVQVLVFSQDLFDFTNNTAVSAKPGYVGFSSGASSNLYCSGGNCTLQNSGLGQPFSKALSVVSWMNTSGLNPRHQYAYQVSINLVVQSITGTIGNATQSGAVATADLDMVASDGHGAKLAWIEIR